MKKRVLLGLISLCFSATAVSAFDRETTDALKACHDYAWSVDEYTDLPNAAVSVYPLMTDGNVITTVWHIMWDDPVVRAAGNCTVIEGNVEGFEDYTKQN
ncbi:MAG: hypothetical protein ABJ360_21525 [Roseobacter sp.]|uniref:hypothetical protein n=1 Tax=Tateyamaria sp. TaxID=1929288 RepID=UPI00326993EB